METLLGLLRQLAIFSPHLLVVSLGVIAVGKVGDPKKIKNKPQLVKIGVIGLVVGFILMLLQVATTYLLLTSY